MLRVPFWGAPLTADEGGYAEAAKLWAQGWHLYTDVWLDRPQGLLVGFRAIRWLGFTSPHDLRVAAAAIGLLVLGATGLVTYRLAGRHATIFAVLLLAISGSSPYIESFTLSGELLALLPTLLALAALTAYAPRGHPLWLVCAGLLAGSALTVKQSALEGVLAGVAYLVWIERRRSVRSIPLLVAPAALPLGIAAAAAPSFHAWWNAVVTYRFYGDSLITGSLLDRLGMLESSLPAAAAGLALPVLLSVAGWRRAPLLTRLWVAAAVLGVIGGGNFHPHYFQQLAPPLCVIGALGLERMTDLRLRVATGAAAVACILLPAGLWAAGPRRQADAIWPHDPHLQVDGTLAAYVRSHTRPEAKVYVLWAAADVYYLADRAPAFRYLWYRNVQTIPGALEAARTMLDERPPALIVAEQWPGGLDRSGKTAAILRRRYRLVRLVSFVPIFRPRAATG